MPPKAKAAAEVQPRRSTRARAERSADTVQQSIPTKQQRKKTSSKSQGVDSEDEPSSPAKSKRKLAATREHDANEHTSTTASKTTNASKKTKASKQQAASATPTADTKQTDDEPSASSRSTQAAQQPSTFAAATKSGQPVPTGVSQADHACPKAQSTEVAGDADVMLNQTNINANNNKFYRMQLLQEGPSDHWLWTRWGRVGDKGQTQLQGPFAADTGLKEFKKKFRFAFCYVHRLFVTRTYRGCIFPFMPSLQTHLQCHGSSIGRAAWLDTKLVNVAWQLLLQCQLAKQLATRRGCFRHHTFSANVCHRFVQV